MEIFSTFEAYHTRYFERFHHLRSDLCCNGLVYASTTLPTWRDQNIGQSIDFEECCLVSNFPSQQQTIMRGVRRLFKIIRPPLLSFCDVQDLPVIFLGSQHHGGCYRWGDGWQHKCTRSDRLSFSNRSTKEAAIEHIIKEVSYINDADGVEYKEEWFRAQRDVCESDTLSCLTAVEALLAVQRITHWAHPLFPFLLRDDWHPRGKCVGHSLSFQFCGRDVHSTGGRAPGIPNYLWIVEKGLWHRRTCVWHLLCFHTFWGMIHSIEWCISASDTNAFPAAAVVSVNFVSWQSCVR